MMNSSEEDREELIEAQNYDLEDQPYEDFTTIGTVSSLLVLIAMTAHPFYFFPCRLDEGQDDGLSASISNATEMEGRRECMDVQLPRLVSDLAVVGHHWYALHCIRL